MKKRFIMTLIAVLLLGGCDAAPYDAPATALPQDSQIPSPSPTLPMPTLDAIAVHTQSPASTDLPQTQAIQVYQSSSAQGVDSQQTTATVSRTTNVEGAMSSRDAVAYLIYCFNSAWIDYVNNNSRDVYLYVAQGSPAQQTVDGFNTAGLTERFENLEICGVYADGADAYAAVHEKISKTSAGTETKAYRWLYHIKKQDGDWKVYSFSQSLPQAMLDKLSSLVDGSKYAEAKSLADVIASVWTVDKKSAFSLGEGCRDLAMAGIYESIDRYDAIEKLQPQDGAQTHKKDQWRLDIASLYVIAGDYESADAIYDAIIAANDCNVVGACLGKAEIFRRRGDDANMKVWFVKAANASENGDMLP